MRGEASSVDLTRGCEGKSREQLIMRYKTKAILLKLGWDEAAPVAVCPRPCFLCERGERRSRVCRQRGRRSAAIFKHLQMEYAAKNGAGYRTLQVADAAHSHRCSVVRGFIVPAGIAPFFSLFLLASPGRPGRSICVSAAINSKSCMQTSLVPLTAVRSEYSSEHSKLHTAKVFLSLIHLQ
jgi:hypothetical protein